MPTCRYCGAPIDFVRTPAGKWMPVQPRGVYARADDAGRRLALDVEGRVLRVSEAAKDTPGVLIVRFPHWEFCPGAEEMRKPEATPPHAPEPPRPEKQPEQISFLEDTHGSKRENRGYWRL